MNPISSLLFVGVVTGVAFARPQETGDAAASDQNEVAERFYGGGSAGIVGSHFGGGYNNNYYQQGGYPAGYYPNNFQNGYYQGTYQGAYPGGFNQGFQSLSPTGVVGTCPSTYGASFPSGGIRARRQATGDAENTETETRFFGGVGGNFGGVGGNYPGVGGNYPGVGGNFGGVGGGYGAGSCYTDYDCSGKFICCPFNGIKQCVQPVF